MSYHSYLISDISDLNYNVHFVNTCTEKQYNQYLKKGNDLEIHVVCMQKPMVGGHTAPITLPSYHIGM